MNRPRVYVTGQDTNYPRQLQDVSVQLVQRGYAVYAPQFECLASPDITYAEWSANEKEWLSMCQALLRIGDHPYEAETWAQERDIPIFYALDTLIVCVRIAANRAAVNSPTGTQALGVLNPALAVSGAITAGITAPTPSRSGRVSVPGRSGGLPVVIPNVLYDGEEWSCPACERRFRAEWSVFDHVAISHHALLRGENPL